MSYLICLTSWIWGSDHDQELAIAAGYLEYLGTDKLSPEQFKQEL